MANFKKILKWFVIVVAGLFFIVYVYRIFYFVNLRKTEAAVAKIHATKLTLDDVMGTNLPPDPGEAADDTIEGVDANKNGIRDDVELAIFEEYPNSAKTRAPLLQYALTLQLQTTLKLLNTATVTATVEDNESRAQICLWTLSSRNNMEKFLSDMERYENYIINLHLNTEDRKQYHKDFYKYLGSYSASNEGCDFEVSDLSD